MRVLLGIRKGIGIVWMGMGGRGRLGLRLL
jgi:hypothetical protein